MCNTNAIKSEWPLVRANLEIPVVGLRDCVDCTTREFVFCIPILADVLEQGTIWVEPVRTADETHQCNPIQRPATLPQPRNHGRYSNFSITTSFSLFNGTWPLSNTYKDMRTDSLPAVGTPEMNTCCFSKEVSALPDPATVENVACPGSQWKECVKTPAHSLGQSRFSSPRGKWSRCLWPTRSR